MPKICVKNGIFHQFHWLNLFSAAMPVLINPFFIQNCRKLININQCTIFHHYTFAKIKKLRRIRFTINKSLVKLWPNPTKICVWMSLQIEAEPWKITQITFAVNFILWPKKANKMVWTSANTHHKHDYRLEAMKIKQTPLHILKSPIHIWFVKSWPHTRAYQTVEIMQCSQRIKTLLKIKISCGFENVFTIFFFKHWVIRCAFPRAFHRINENQFS